MTGVRAVGVDFPNERHDYTANRCWPIQILPGARLVLVEKGSSAMKHRVTPKLVAARTPSWVPI